MASLSFTRIPLFELTAFCASVISAIVVPERITNIEPFLLLATVDVDIPFFQSVCGVLIGA